MKNNTFKRVLAGSLALLTVAAYVPANVGGILPDLSIVASAATEVTDADLVDYKLLSDVIFDVDEDTVPFVEGLYEITTNAGKFVYNTPKKDADIYKLTSGKAYVLRTKAILDGSITTATLANKDLNGDALPEDVYEYVIAKDTISGKVKVASVNVSATGMTVNEKLTVNQNGKEIKYDGGVYSVAKGFPVEITATPGETHTNMMLQATGADTKSQTKEGTALTLTVVPTDAVTVSWAEYKPTLQLTNDNGSIKATDVGFNKLVENVEIGTYEFRYGYGSTTFTAGGTNAKGEYVADSKSYGSVSVTAKPVTVGNTTYTFLNAAGSSTAYTKDDVAYTLDADSDGNPDDMKKGKYVATTTIALNSSAVQAGPLKIVKEFTVADPTGVSSIVFEAIKTVGSSTYEVIQPEAGTGIYSVPWTGKEIVPKLTLMQPDGKTPYTENKEYTVTGTTKATDIGTYTMTISPKDKNFNEGKSIEITWKIVDSNSYVEFKNSKQDNTASDPVFSIGYRQASIATIKEQITKKLNFVGSQELYVVKYTTDTDTTTKVTDPSEKAGTYIAYVANALQNDGETSAMRKNNAVYEYAATGDEQYLDGAGLLKVYFKVTPTQVQIVPTVTEITYGDDVKLSNLYKVIDFATKEEIGVPWSVKPTIALTGKNGETRQTEDQSTTDLPAGEYTYNVTAKPLDEDNYKVLVYDGTNLDKIDFTVNPRNLSDMEFEVASVEANPDTGKADITKEAISKAANSIIANPALIGYEKEINGRIKLVNDKPVYADDTTDFVISGGTTSVKVSETGKMFTVNIKGTGNFTGTKAVSWKIGSDGLPEGVLSYEAEFDAAKPRVMAKLDLSKLDGDVVQGGFLYNNNGKMNDIPLAEATNILKNEAGQTGNANQRNCKVVSFSEKAVKSALSGDGVLTAEIANSSVLKQVYIVPYVVYANGNVSYGTAEKFNYYDMVMTAEGALEMSKTDFVGDGKTGTAGQTYVKVDVTRVDKKGYDVERYGILYNNSDSWDADSTPETADIAEMEKAYKWLDLNNESEKTVKVAEIPEKDLATKIGTNTYIANTTAKSGTGKTQKDLGYGAKNVFARAFIQIKDAAGNSKVYYSNLADVTYGGFTVDTATGAVKSVETAKYVLDTNNKTQILFYAPNTSGTGDAMTRMAASTGDKTFAEWFDEQKNK